MNKPVEITDEFTEIDGEWSGYDVIPINQNEAFRKQKHVDIRSFVSEQLGTQVIMLYMDRLSISFLDGKEIGDFSSDASPAARILVVNNEGWTFGTVAPQTDRNNWNGISVVCDPEISGVTTTQSVITQNG